MRIGRAVIIPAILAIGTASSALAGGAVVTAAQSVAVAHMQPGSGMHVHGTPSGLTSNVIADPGTGTSTGTDMYHHG